LPNRFDVEAPASSSASVSVTPAEADGDASRMSHHSLVNR
jgi:hypothetical protein